MPINPININVALSMLRALHKSNKIVSHYEDKTGQTPIAYRRKLVFKNSEDPAMSPTACLFTYVCDGSFKPIASHVYQPFTRVRVRFDSTGDAKDIFMREVPNVQIGEELEFKTRSKITDGELVNPQCFIIENDREIKGNWYPFPKPEDPEVAKVLEDQKYKMLLFLKASLKVSLYTKQELESMN